MFCFIQVFTLHQNTHSGYHSHHNACVLLANVSIHHLTTKAEDLWSLPSVPEDESFSSPSYPVTYP